MYVVLKTKDLFHTTGTTALFDLCKDHGNQPLRDLLLIPFLTKYSNECQISEVSVGLIHVASYFCSKSLVRLKKIPLSYKIK